MGKIGSRNYELPARMFVRKRGGVDYFFCHVGTGKTRQEVSLGSNLRDAIVRCMALEDEADSHQARVPSDYYKVLHFRMLRSARTRGIEFMLSVDDVMKMMDRAGGRCEVSNIAFSLSKQDRMRIRPWMPSIDRINATLPYEPGNCRVVCAAVNLALNQFGDKMFFKIASAVSRNLHFCGTAVPNCGNENAHC